MSKQTDFDFGYNDPSNANPWGGQQCMGLLVCPHCGRSAMCGDIASLPDEKQFHHPTTEELDNMDLSSHRSKDRGNKGGKFVRRPFLKASDIPAKGGLKCKVIDFRTAPKQMEYSDFLMDVSAGKKEYTVGLRSESVLIDMICDELGTKTEKYPGKTITFVRGGNKGQYINVG